MKFSDDYRPRGRAARSAPLPADLDWSDVYADAARMEAERDSRPCSLSTVYGGEAWCDTHDSAAPCPFSDAR